MTSKFANMMSASHFLTAFFSLVKFSYCSKFHVNIIIGSGVMTIFFYKRLTINPEIGNTPVGVLLVRDTKFGMIVYNEMLLNASNARSYSFYRF